MIYDPMYLQTIYVDLHITETFRTPTRLALGYKRNCVWGGSESEKVII